MIVNEIIERERIEGRIIICRITTNIKVFEKLQLSDRRYVNYMIIVEVKIFQSPEIGKRGYIDDTVIL